MSLDEKSFTIEMQQNTKIQHSFFFFFYAHSFLSLSLSTRKERTIKEKRCYLFSLKNSEVLEIEISFMFLLSIEYHCHTELSRFIRISYIISSTIEFFTSITECNELHQSCTDYFQFKSSEILSHTLSMSTTEGH